MPRATASRIGLARRSCPTLSRFPADNQRIAGSWRKFRRRGDLNEYLRLRRHRQHRQIRCRGRKFLRIYEDLLPARKPSINGFVDGVDSADGADGRSAWLRLRSLILIMRVPARPSRLKVISIPSARRDVCARRSRPASARGDFDQPAPVKNASSLG